MFFLASTIGILECVSSKMLGPSQQGVMAGQSSQTAPASARYWL